MEHVNLLEEIKQFRILSNHYEKQLKLLDIRIDDLPIEILTMLDECVDLQKKTNLHDVSLPFLKMYYFNKKKEHIERKANIRTLENAIQEQQVKLKKEEEECKILEEFIATCQRRMKSEEEIKNNEILMEKKNADLEKILKNMNVPKDVNMDVLINSTELLTKHVEK